MTSTQPNYVPRTDGFDATVVHDNFSKSVEIDGVGVSEYLDGFTELARFFDMMGTLFSTMAADIRHQIKTIHAFQKGPTSDHYKTLLGMIQYETADPTRIEPKAKHQSGTRSMVHLNRQLDFLTQLIGQMINDLGDDARLAGVCQAVYKGTLAHHDSWLISKAAHLAMGTMPTKFKLFERVSKYPYPESLELTGKMVKAMQAALTAVDELIKNNNLQTLPH